jgi:hypothetical protein
MAPSLAASSSSVFSELVDLAVVEAGVIVVVVVMAVEGEGEGEGESLGRAAERRAASCCCW